MSREVQILFETESMEEPPKDEIPTKIFFKKPFEIEIPDDDSDDDSDVDDEEVSLFVKKVVKEKSQIQSSKTLSTEQISELYSKLAEIPKKPATKREKLPLEERILKRDRKSLQVITSSLHKILSHAAFVIIHKSKPIRKSRLSCTVFGSSQADKDSSSEETIQHKKKVEFVSNISIIQQITRPDFAYHHRALFFWSAFIQNYVSLLRPVKLLAFDV